MGYATKEELTQVAKKYCEREGYEFLFANEEKFGFQDKNGQLWTLDYFGLYDILRKEEEKKREVK